MSATGERDMRRECNLVIVPVIILRDKMRSTHSPALNLLHLTPALLQKERERKKERKRRTETEIEHSTATERGIGRGGSEEALKWKKRERERGESK